MSVAFFLKGSIIFLDPGNWIGNGEVWIKIKWLPPASSHLNNKKKSNAALLQNIFSVVLCKLVLLVM